MLGMWKNKKITFSTSSLSLSSVRPGVNWKFSPDRKILSFHLSWNIHCKELIALDFLMQCFMGYVLCTLILKQISLSILLMNFFVVWQVEEQNWRIEFVELVSYCANKCLTASTIFCSTFAEHLNKLAGDLCPVSCLDHLIIYPRAISLFWQVHLPKYLYF